MKRRTRRKTAHWVIEYNHESDCALSTNGGAIIGECDCSGGGEWSRVSETFFSTSVRNKPVSKPRSLGLVLQAVLDRRELLEQFQKLGVSYRIYNVKTKEAYPVEAFQS